MKKQKRIGSTVPDFLKITETNAVVKCTAINVKNREHDVEDCHGKQFTIQQTEISDEEVTLKEKMDFWKTNPATN